MKKEDMQKGSSEKQPLKERDVWHRESSIEDDGQEPKSDGYDTPGP